VIVSDIAGDPYGLTSRRCLNYGLRARGLSLTLKNQQVLGTFGLLCGARTPDETDLRLIEGAGHIAVIAMRESDRSGLTKSEAELRRHRWQYLAHRSYWADGKFCT